MGYWEASNVPQPICCIVSMDNPSTSVKAQMQALWEAGDGKLAGGGKLASAVQRNKPGNRPLLHSLLFFVF